MDHFCRRCGSNYVNRKPKGEAGTKPIAFAIAIALVFICVKVLGAITGGGYVGGLFLLFVFGIVIGPVVLLIAYLVAASITGDGKNHTATCHNCGLEWHEKGACPPKQTAPSQYPQTGAQTPSRR